MTAPSLDEGTMGGRQRTKQSRIRVLVADDAPRMRAMIAAFLSDQSGIEVVGTAADGREVLEQVHTLEPDVVVLDYQMQNMSGLEATVALRAGHRATRVIIVTIHDGDVVRAACAASGADGFVAKSRVYQDLPSEIARVVGSGRREG